MSAERLPLPDRLVALTETWLTKRKQRQVRTKAKQAKKHPIIDWLEAFLWAAAVVLIVNQYFLQAYQIPSPSMVNTLKVGDRIFVDKFTLGPELLPTIAKLPGLSEPKRGQIVCFENPEYQSSGPVFLVFQRIIYMLTLSLVDIDRDDQGEQKKYLLIKRAIGMAGDQIRYRLGEFEIKAPGETWLPEASFKKLANLSYKENRLRTPEEMRLNQLYGLFVAHQNRRVPVQPEEQRAYETIMANDREYDTWRRAHPTEANEGFRTGIGTAIEITHNDVLETYRMFPLLRPSIDLAEAANGWYVPANGILPLGDNRDDSKDGRYFGPVKNEKILGKALFIFWPLNRFGAVQ